MATFRKRNRRWQAIIRRRGHPVQSRSFGSRKDADAWARSVEHAMEVGDFLPPDDSAGLNLGEVLRRYLSEVSVNKRGGEIEGHRIRALLRLDLARHSMAGFRRA